MKKYTQYKNAYAREKYDRINLVLKKGWKDRIKAACSDNGISVNEYLFRLICADMDGNEESRVMSQQEELTPEQHKLLDKWQVAQKYRNMIESMNVDEINGMNKRYTIILKEGFVNDATQSRIIYCTKTAELRKLITKSRQK